MPVASKQYLALPASPKAASSPLPLSHCLCLCLLFFCSPFPRTLPHPEKPRFSPKRNGRIIPSISHPIRFVSPAPSPCFFLFFPSLSFPVKTTKQNPPSPKLILSPLFGLSVSWFQAPNSYSTTEITELAGHPLDRNLISEKINNEKNR